MSIEAFFAWQEGQSEDYELFGGVRGPNAMKAAQLKLMAEVLAPSTGDLDAFEKLGDYRTLEILDHILLIEVNAAKIMHWARETDRSWRKQRIAGLDLTSPGIALALSYLYDGVGFPAGPRLVQNEPLVGAAG